MSLTLGNNLTGLVSRQVDADGRKARGLGESMTTGNNKFVSVVDAFLGSSLRDNEVILGAVAKNTAYSVNMLSIADEYMSSMATALQGALTASSSAGQVSADKIPTLQASLDDKITQLKLLIRTADFDNKALFSGGVKNLGVQVGLNTNDKLIVNIKDISGGKVLRSSVTSALNKHIAANSTDADANAYYGKANGVGAARLATDKENNTNLAITALTAGANSMSNAQFGTALHAVIRDKPAFGAFLNEALPTFKAALNRANAGISFTDASAANIGAAVVVGNVGDEDYAAKGAPRAEMLALLADTAPTTLNTAAGRAIAQDVIKNSLDYIRQEQSSISNQKSNIVETTDALRATTNVTQQAADSYLKADYVLTAQEYSETLRTMVAAITALQAANKIPEAAQRLLDALVR